MIRKFMFLLTSLFFFCQSLQTVHSETIPRQSSSISPSQWSSVHRTLSAKPNDLFVVLKNGLTVLIHPRSGSEVVSARVFVRAGSIYEDEYLGAGLSHYLEHIVSGGSTRSFTEEEAKKRLERIGGETNAYTSFDRTVYYINTISEHWKEAVDLLLSYVTENILDPQEVAREKPVIQQEIKLGENHVDRELWKLFMKTAYRIHPVRHPIIGYEEVLVRQNRDALADYYSKRYQPENMVVVVAGNVNPSEVLEFIIEKTSPFARTASTHVVWPAEPTQLNSRWEEKRLPIARLTQVMLGFPSVTLQDEDLYALDVLAFLLGEGRTSRLYQRLKDQENKVLSVSAFNWTPSFVHGQFIISLNLAPDNWPGVLTSIREEVDHFKTEPVAQEELEKAKKASIAQHIFGKDSASAIASSLGSSFFDTGDPYFDETYVERIRTVTPEQIQDVAQRYLDPDKMNVAIIQPEDAPQASHELAAAGTESGSAGFNELENGLKVILKQDSSLPMVTLQLYGLGGLLLEDREQPGLSAFTASLITSGTQKRSKLDIARSIEEVGGSIVSNSENSTYHVAIKVLKEDLDMALDILADVVRNAQFPQPEIDKRRQETLLAIQRQDENWQTELLRVFKTNYFKVSSYGNERLGTKESVQSLTREDILSFYKQMVNPNHSVLAVYGDLNPENTLEKVREKFGNWVRSPLDRRQWHQETRPLTEDRLIEQKSEKTSAALFIGTNGLSIEDADRPVIEVLNAILSGSGGPGGRLFDSLRGGREDLVYVVGSFPFTGKEAGFFGAITQTTLGNLDRVQNIILENLRRMSETPVSSEDLETAKNILITSHYMDMESLDAQARSAAVNEVLGLGWKYDETYEERIRAVTSQDVQRLARALFSHTLIVRMVPENPVEILAPAMEQEVGRTHLPPQ